MSLELSYYFMHPEKFPIPGFLDGLRSPEEILSKANTYLKSTLVEQNIKTNKATVKCGSVHTSGHYFIGEGTIIFGDVTIIGPAYIGSHCEIMPGAVIRPYTIIGDMCTIGHGSEVKHSVLFEGARVATLAFVGDSVLGVSARVGSGVVTANRRFDQSNAALKLDGVRHNLGDSYFGVILGDSSHLGANSVTQPGTHIGPNTWIFPMTNVRGFIPRDKRVFNEQKTVMTDNEPFEPGP